MRHQRSGKKLGRDASHRKALYSNLAGALIEHGRIRTTETKAKAVKPIAEKMITLGRRGDLHARRQAVAFLRSKDVVHKLFAEVGPRYKDRPGGYSRIVKIGPRQGDAAEMVYLELVEEAYEPRPRRERAAAVPASRPAEAAEEAPATEAETVEAPEGAVDAEVGVEVVEGDEAEATATAEGEGEPTGESEAAPPDEQSEPDQPRSDQQPS